MITQYTGLAMTIANDPSDFAPRPPARRKGPFSPLVWFFHLVPDPAAAPGERLGVNDTARLRVNQ